METNVSWLEGDYVPLLTAKMWTTPSANPRCFPITSVLISCVQMERGQVRERRTETVISWADGTKHTADILCRATEREMFLYWKFSNIPSYNSVCQTVFCHLKQHKPVLKPVLFERSTRWSFDWVSWRNGCSSTWHCMKKCFLKKFFLTIFYQILFFSLALTC